MWQRFTEQAKRIVFYAQQEAIQLGPTDVAAEHLLLGLLREIMTEKNVWPPAPTDKMDLHEIAASLLNEAGVNLEHLRESTQHQIKLLGLTPCQDVDNLSLLPSGKYVIDLMYKEARSMRVESMAPEFMLLALSDPNKGTTGQILAQSGFDVETARQKVAALYLPPKKERHTNPPFWSRLFAKRSKSRSDETHTL